MPMFRLDLPAGAYSLGPDHPGRGPDDHRACIGRELPTTRTRVMAWYSCTKLPMGVNVGANPRTARLPGFLTVPQAAGITGPLNEQRATRWSVR